MGRFSNLALVTLLAATTLGSGCTHWEVVKQGDPNPFVGQKRFQIEPMDYSGFKHGKDGEEGFEKDKKMFDATYSQSLRSEADGLDWVESPGDGTVVIRTQVLNLDGGISMGIGSTRAESKLRVQLVKDGTVHDEIIVEADAQQGSTKVFGIATGGYTGGARIKEMAEKLGEYVADYLDSRL